MSNLPTLPSTEEPPCMTDFEIIKWLERNMSKLGVRPEWQGVFTDGRYYEFTDIRTLVKQKAHHEPTD